VLGIRLTDGLSVEVGLELLSGSVARAEVAAEAGDVFVAPGRTARALVAERARGDAAAREACGDGRRGAGRRDARARAWRGDGEGDGERRGQSGAGVRTMPLVDEGKAAKKGSLSEIRDLARRARDAGARASGREGCVDAPSEGATRALVLKAAETANISLRGCGVKCARCRGTDISGSRRLRSSASHANDRTRRISRRMDESSLSHFAHRYQSRHGS